MERRVYRTMYERLAVFLFSVLMAVGSLAGAVWVIATGQAVNMDGIFMLLAFLVFALIFALCIWSLIKGALASALPAAAPAKAAAERAAPAPAVKASQAQSQPAVTH